MKVGLGCEVTSGESFAASNGMITSENTAETLSEAGAGLLTGVIRTKFKPAHADNKQSEN